MEGGSNGINQAKKRGKEKHKEGSIGGKEKTHNRTFAEIGTHRAWQASRIHSQKEEKVSQKSLETCVPFMTCEIRIGTSGYHYKHWQGPFYSKKISPDEMLDFYSQHFDTVELNNSFYRLPTEAAFDNWRESTPADFVFAVKASRFLTHQKKLKDPEGALENFLPRAARLSTKLGPILFQLPPKWQVNPGRLESLLEALPRDHRYAFEFRDLTWIRPEINQLLAKSRAAFCIYELAGYHSPLTITSDFAYVRLHGPVLEKYQGSYSTGRLHRWAQQVAEWAKYLAAIYIYFDNDQAGYAARNALTLKRMVSPDKRSRVDLLSTPRTRPIQAPR